MSVHRCGGTRNGLTRRRIRQLDDEELESSDDADRTEHMPEEAEQEYIAQERITMDLEIPRQPIPEPSDGEVCVQQLQHWEYTLTLSRCTCSKYPTSCQ